jgi:hypothetical protein
VAECSNRCVVSVASGASATDVSRETLKGVCRWSGGRALPYGGRLPRRAYRSLSQPRQDRFLRDRCNAAAAQPMSCHAHALPVGRCGSCASPWSCTRLVTCGQAVARGRDPGGVGDESASIGRVAWWMLRVWRSRMGSAGYRGAPRDGAAVTATQSPWRSSGVSRETVHGQSGLEGLQGSVQGGQGRFWPGRAGNSSVRPRLQRGRVGGEAKIRAGRGAPPMTSRGVLANVQGWFGDVSSGSVHGNRARRGCPGIRGILDRFVPACVCRHA